MKTLYHTIILIVLLAFIGEGCTTTGKSANKCGPCPLYFAEVLPNLGFRVFDKATGKNLFFGPGAPYKPSQLVMMQLVNGKPDSARLFADTANQSFRVYVVPNHTVDTVTMNIANKPQDALLFKTGTTEGCCPQLELVSVTYDGTVVYTTPDGPKIVSLSK